MEIITYVRKGAITQEDSLGDKGRTEACDFQVVSAGTSERHSEDETEDFSDMDRNDPQRRTAQLERLSLPHG